MLDEMQQQMKSEILRSFGKEQAQRLGFLKADSAVRLDGREVRLEAADDDLTQVRRDFEERIATTGCCTDGERADALKELARQRKQSAWMEKFRQQRFAEASARADGATDALKAAKTIGNAIA